MLDSERNIKWQVIGVARDGKYRELREQPETNLWRPLTQQPRQFLTLIVRTRGEPLAKTETLRSTLRSLDPAIPMFDVRSLEQHIALATSQERMATRLTSAFALLALLLSAVGLYGLLAFIVAQQTREIGVRMALGAQRMTVLRDVMGSGLKLVALGVLVGLPLDLGHSSAGRAALRHRPDRSDDFPGECLCAAERRHGRNVASRASRHSCGSDGGVAVGVTKPEGEGEGE